MSQFIFSCFFGGEIRCLVGLFCVCVDSSVAGAKRFSRVGGFYWFKMVQVF